MTVTINVARKRTANRPPEHIFHAELNRPSRLRSCTARDSSYEKSKACAIARTLAQVFPPDRFEITVSAEATYSEYLNWEEEGSE